MSLGQVVFLTKENEAELRVAADMRSYFEQLDHRARETDEGKN